MIDFLAPLLEWTKHWLLDLHPASLFWLSFVESIFFPIPPDVVLLPLSALRPESAPLYGLLATVGSVSGALAGYALGLWGGRPVLRRFVSAERVDRVERLFQRYDAWAIGIAGFTPIPYKVFTLAAGVFHLSIPRFVIVSLVSRGARFMAEALLVMHFGETVVQFVGDHFDWLTLVVAAVVIAVYVVVVRARRRSCS